MVNKYANPKTVLAFANLQNYFARQPRLTPPSNN